MTQPEFHEAFQELLSAFPTARIGELVEANWFKRFHKKSKYRVKSAFNLLATEDRFPTLGAALAMTKEISSDRISYVCPEWGFCYKEMLAEGQVQCGCQNCHPTIYERFSQRYHKTYGHWPWEHINAAGQWEKRGEQLARDIGGRDGLNQLRNELKAAKVDWIKSMP